MPALLGALHIMNMGEEGAAYVSAEIMVGASGSKLRPFRRGGPQSDKDFGDVEASEWWNIFSNRECLRDQG